MCIWIYDWVMSSLIFWWIQVWGKDTIHGMYMLCVCFSLGGGLVGASRGWMPLPIAHFLFPSAEPPPPRVASRTWLAIRASNGRKLPAKAKPRMAKVEKIVIEISQSSP